MGPVKKDLEVQGETKLSGNIGKHKVILQTVSGQKMVLINLLSNLKGT